mmetsp:Transcript_3603/g.5469  ORF Transcript_3603/g.5469 Transcript_3603/m.5469 type:complete len:436 (+) Transcript_3603:242-1549(+)|eukprot:CAMPEP_0184675638 /NCGR_PEP_ID=MMETSP0308-20130426/87898_1 /TAXON_ID=38269 /ORGANISM="Gloeochaete witrockiana, Strain SAG 46.84" /LENGTH=435 /DNA_ID=CAMNT_0027123359 /DNA_START=175 /DNA_END=1482 /DNA_ORIENTATION=+
MNQTWSDRLPGPASLLATQYFSTAPSRSDTSIRAPSASYESYPYGAQTYFPPRNGTFTSPRHAFQPVPLVSSMSDTAGRHQTMSQPAFTAAIQSRQPNQIDQPREPMLYALKSDSFRSSGSGATSRVSPTKPTTSDGQPVSVDIDLKRRRLHPDHVPRPQNSFMIFSNDHRAMVQSNNPKLSNQEVSKVLGSLWSALDPAARAQYSQRASSIRDLFRQSHPEYKFTRRSVRKQPASSTSTTTAATTPKGTPSSTSKMATDMPTSPAESMSPNHVSTHNNNNNNNNNKRPRSSPDEMPCDRLRPLRPKPIVEIPTPVSPHDSESPTYPPSLVCVSSSSSSTSSSSSPPPSPASSSDLIHDHPSLQCGKTSSPRPMMIEERENNTRYTYPQACHGSLDLLVSVAAQQHCVIREEARVERPPQRESFRGRISIADLLG